MFLLQFPCIHIGNNVAVYGSGVDGKINDIGWILIILMIISCYLLLKGVKDVENEMMKKGERTIKRIGSTNSNKKISEKEFKW